MQTNNKLREALEGIRRDLWDLMGSSSESFRESLACKINATIRTVLAEPPRNCDVGSAEEQYRRFCVCCTEHKMPCRRSYTFGCAACYAKWAQMPYESEVKE